MLFVYESIDSGADRWIQLEAQSKSLYEYAKYRELEIADEYCDAGKSGKDIKGRPAFQQMMETSFARKTAFPMFLFLNYPDSEEMLRIS